MTNYTPKGHHQACYDTARKGMETELGGTVMPQQDWASAKQNRGKVVKMPLGQKLSQKQAKRRKCLQPQLGD